MKAAGNENEDVAEHLAYPTNFKNVTDDKPFVNNVLVVGASTNDNNALRASFPITIKNGKCICTGAGNLFYRSSQRI